MQHAAGKSAIAPLPAKMRTFACARDATRIRQYQLDAALRAVQSELALVAHSHDVVAFAAWGEGAVKAALERRDGLASSA
jgi:hypothetical protein